MDADIHPFESSPPLATIDSTSNELVDFPVDSDLMNIDEYSPLDFEEFELIWRDQNGYLSKGLEERKVTEKCSPRPSTIWSAGAISISTMDASLIQQPLTLPTGDIEIDNQLSVHHLVKAYKEAMENKEAELAEVLTRKISKKVGPTGEIDEHLLKIFPDGMISHFTANSVILEAKPRDTDVLHIIDFDMGEGMQWSSMIMALGRKQKELQTHNTMKVRGDTKRRLHDCANPFGLILEVEEVELQDLARKIKGKRKGGERREWLAFNCMWALSQMGRKRSRRHVLDFVRMAKEILASISVYSNTSNGGILTFGDGGAWELFKDCPALLESIEWKFPNCFIEARIAMECLFVAPYASSRAWIQELEGLRLSNESLLEAKEMVREGEAPYAVRIEGENYIEMVWEFRGTQLIKFSA
uniref:Uncharacterized protein n=1 Tax=Populus trichocarpa TaxID=3694 RepID=U7E145_POPTR